MGGNISVFCRAWPGLDRLGSARLELKHCLSISMVYIAPHGPHPWVAKFGPGPIESLAMMLGHFVDNSEQFVGNPKRNKFPPPRGFHVEGGSWKLSGSSNSSATYSFRRQAHNAPHKPQQPRKHTPPNRRPEATMQGGNILTISAFYLIGGIAPGLGGAVCFVDATVSCCTTPHTLPTLQQPGVGFT